MRFPFTLCRDASSHNLRWPPYPPVAGDTTLQRETFARDLASYEALVLVQARLKTAIIASILPADLVALRDPLHFARCASNFWPSFRGPFFDWVINCLHLEKIFPSLNPRASQFAARWQRMLYTVHSLVPYRYV